MRAGRFPGWVKEVSHHHQTRPNGSVLDNDGWTIGRAPTSSSSSFKLKEQRAWIVGFENGWRIDFRVSLQQQEEHAREYVGETSGSQFDWEGMLIKHSQQQQ